MKFAYMPKPKKDKTVWHKHFLWFPMLMRDGERGDERLIVWLCQVERKLSGYFLWYKTEHNEKVYYKKIDTYDY